MNKLLWIKRRLEENFIFCLDTLLMFNDRAMLINQIGIIGTQINFMWHKVVAE